MSAKIESGNNPGKHYPYGSIDIGEEMEPVTTTASKKFSKFAIANFIFGALGIVSMIAAAGIVYGYSLGSAQAKTTEMPVVLKADTAARGKSISMATGLLDTRELLEGLFILDHLTGELQFWVMNNNTGKVGAAYKLDVGKLLDPKKSGDADYVMATGQIEFDGGRAGGGERGSSVCYIADSNSGAVVCVGILYNRTTGNGSLDVLAIGKTRGGSQRDQ